MAAWLQVLAVVAVLAVVHVPLGDYLARVYTRRRHWRVEKVLYRMCGVDPDAEQRWTHYAGALLAFSAVGVLLIYLLLRVQARLPWAVGHRGVAPALAFNTVVSFTTNTSWQAYAGEATLGHTAQMVGLGTAAFASAAVGLAAAVALIRGLTRRQADQICNFWVDLTRSIHPSGRNSTPRHGQHPSRPPPPPTQHQHLSTMRTVGGPITARTTLCCPRTAPRPPSRGYNWSGLPAGRGPSHN